LCNFGPLQRLLLVTIRTFEETMSIRSAALSAALALVFASACNRSSPERDAAVSGRVGGAADETSSAVGLARAAAPPMTSPEPGAQLAAIQFPVSTASDSIAPTMVIRTGQASVEVDSLGAAVQVTRSLAQRVGGWVANSAVQSGREQVRTATIEIKVPAPRFDQLVEGLRPIGKVEFVNTTAEDVGEEFVDIEARVVNAKRLEQRLIELLATRTGKLSDVLAVEQQLARVREEIERMEGRMRYLRARSAVSTLSVTLHEKYPVIAGTGSWGVIGEAFAQAWRNFVGFVAGGIEMLGVLVPLAAIVAAIALAVRRYVPRRLKPLPSEVPPAA
jgi:hypothetical protein